MLVADTSALLSLASIDIYRTVLSEFDVHTTATAVEELKATAEYEDRHGKAADRVLADLDRMTVHQVENREFQSSRIDRGEGTCVQLTNDVGAEFLLTDDLRALPELQTVADAQVAISLIVLKALLKRDVLESSEARDKLDQLAEQRNWLGAPIYKRAQDLLD